MIFGIETRPGDRVDRMIELTLGGEKISLPLFIIHGKKEGLTLGITAGIHGTEYASIEAALRLGRTLDPAGLSGKVAILPVVNLPSYKRRTIYVGPLDGKNLNRVFPGNAGGTFSEALAHQVFQELIHQSNCYIDLHGGDMNEALVPFVIYSPCGNPQVDERSLSMAKVFGIERIVASEMRGATIHAASRAGVPAILAEAGGQGIWSEETVGIHVRGLHRVMGGLGMLAEKPEPQPSQVTSFPWLYSEHDGVFYPRVAIGDKVSAGQKVGSVCDYFGRELQAVMSPTNGIVLFLVTSLAINQKDPLMGIGG